MIIGNANTLKVVENVDSTLSETIGDNYTSAKAYSPNLNSHMLKNSEWGAVAYLTESTYGRNGNIVKPNENSNLTAEGDFIANKKQSSTGNETGIYDLVGGAYDRVSAYYSKGSSNILNYGSSLVNDYKNSGTKKYLNVYDGEVLKLNYKIGDATYETEGWKNGANVFISSTGPFLTRGGLSSPSIVSMTTGTSGYSAQDNGVSFRLSLIIK